MQKKTIELNGKRYQFRAEGCLYGLYELDPDETRCTALQVAAAILLPALTGLAILFHAVGAF